MLLANATLNIKNTIQCYNYSNMHEQFKQTSITKTVTTKTASSERKFTRKGTTTAFITGTKKHQHITDNFKSTTGKNSNNKNERNRNYNN